MNREEALNNSMKSFSINSCACNNASDSRNGCCTKAKKAIAETSNGQIINTVTTGHLSPSANVNVNKTTSPTSSSSSQGVDTLDNVVHCSGRSCSAAVVTSSFSAAFSNSLLTKQQAEVVASAISVTPNPAPYASASVAEKRKMVHELCQQLILTDEQIEELTYRILNEIKRGLRKDTHEKANVKCFITYVQDLPNGNERGKFLALDLGGTNFRVLLIHLKEEHDFQMESRIYAIPQHIMLGSGTQLFDHIAECLANFMSEHNVYKERLPLGFTFSFPLRQLGLTKGLLATWTKGFNCDGVVDRDVVQLLKDAIARRGDVQIDVCAILNDTTGTLMSCAWKNHSCRIGLIVGTGSNACYVETVEEAELFDEADNGKSHVLINTEWGAFGDNGALDFVRTEFDEDVDKHSINPGKQVFEKMISGMYMGELVRLVIVKMVKAGVLFRGQNSDVLMTRGLFFTKYVSEIEADEPGTYTNCRLVLDELGLDDATDEDCANVRYICECVSKRAAHLVSSGIATLINKMNEPHVTVGVDGSVYRFHPKFHNLMVEKITQLLKPGLTFDLMLSEDGSGRGAALVAAVACRDKKDE